MDVGLGHFRQFMLDHVRDFRHVDAGGEQVNRDGHVGAALVLVAANQVQRLVGGARDLDDGVVLDAAVLSDERIL